jgi:hypothetical protein
MQIINIRYPAFPASVSLKEDFTRENYESGFAFHLVVQGNSAYFTLDLCQVFGGIYMCGGPLLIRLDITNPGSPVVVDTFENGSVRDLIVSPGWLYTLVYDGYSAQNRMVVFDISSPQSMVEIVSIESLGSSIALAGEYVFNAGNNGIQVIDVSDPTQPISIKYHYLPEGITGIFINATTAYITYLDSILILDVADPLNPVNLGMYQSTGQSLDLSVDGMTAYSTNGVEGIEIFDTATLSQVGLIEYPQNINDIVVAGDYAYAAGDDGLWVLDITDPDIPFPLVQMEVLSPTVSLVLGGSFAFLASPNDGIHVIDVSEPITPAEAAFYPLPLDLRQLVLVENKLYAAAGWNGLHILDVSDPYHMEEIGAFTPAYGINAVAVAGRYAFLAASNDNLILLDISDPDSLDVDGVYDPPDNDYGMGQGGSAVAVQGSTVLLGIILYAPTPLAGADGGYVLILDVSEPEQPVEVGRLVGGAPYRINIEDNQAHVVYERGGLYIYDISNPAAVQELGRYDPSEYTYGMTVDGERIYLYNQSIFILRYLDPSLPSFGGIVAHANHQPYPGVPVSVGDALPEKVSDMQGEYAFRGVTEGTYSLTPSLPGYVFSPPSRTVSVPPSAFGQNFTILPEPVQIDFTPGISTTLTYTDTQGLPTRLEIPGDASNTPLTLQLVPTISDAAPGYAFAGHAFELNGSVAGEWASGIVFNAPLTVTIKYSPQDIGVIADINKLTLWWWDGAAWQDAAQSCLPATEYSRDPDNFILSVLICQTGVYKLMGPTQQVFLPMIPSGE